MKKCKCKNLNEDLIRFLKWLEKNNAIRDYIFEPYTIETDWKSEVVEMFLKEKNHDDEGGLSEKMN